MTIDFPSTARDMIGNVLVNIQKASEDKRRRWYTQGTEIAQYGYSPTHLFQYQNLPAEAFFHAKEALTSECLRVMGPYLYQQNPHRTAKAREDAEPIIITATAVMERYLNHTLREYDAFHHARMMIDQSICWGRGIRWTQRHPKKPDVICSLYDNVEYFFDDPEAKIPEDRRIVMRLRKRPIEDVIREMPECESQIRAAQREKTDKDCGDMLEYYEAHAICGIWRFQSTGALYQAIKAGGMEPSDQPLKYLFTSQGKFICACDWDVPFYQDGEWPCTILDYFDYPNELWPVSPLEPGLNYQRAINWCSTLMMGRMRQAMRGIYAIADINGEGIDAIAKSQFLQGADIEALLIKVTNNRNIGDFIKEAPVSFEWLTQGMAYLDRLEDRYNQVTGKYSVLSTGQGETQDRSAAATSMRERNSRSRIEDMRSRIISAETEISRKEAMAARFLLGSKEIGVLLGKPAGQAWGFLAAPEAKGEFVQQLLAVGYPPEMAEAKAAETFADAIDPKKWVSETDFSVEADTIRRFDHDQRLEVLKESNNQWTPALIQSQNLVEKAMGFREHGEYLKQLGETDLSRKYATLADAYENQAAQAPPVAPTPALPAPAGG